MQAGYSSYAQELRAGKPVVAQTVGDSMQPLLFQGKTQVVLVPLSGPLKRGDLPLYQRPSGQYVLHRIVRAENGVYYTRGDNRYGAERVEPDWVLGVTTEVLRDGRTIRVSDFGYRCYVAVWLASYPVRYVVKQPKRTLYHLKKALHLDGGHP